MRTQPVEPQLRDVAFFVSYAEADRRAAADLLERLRPHLAASRRFRYAGWEFHQLLVGERWNERIQEEIRVCDFGLLLLSPRFLASEYIVRQELPHFVGSAGKPVVPVGLGRVDFQRHDLKGLGEFQIFRRGTRFYAELRSVAREAFALALFGQIEDRLALLGTEA